MILYKLTMLCMVTKLEYLPENDKEGIGSINREGRIDKYMISAIAWWVIIKTVIDKYKSCQLPQKTNKCKEVKVSVLYNPVLVFFFFPLFSFTQRKETMPFKTAVSKYQ